MYTVQGPCGTIDLMLKGWPNRSIQTAGRQQIHTSLLLLLVLVGPWIELYILASCERISETGTPYVDAPIFR